MTRRLTPGELEDFRKEAWLVAIANPLPDGSRRHIWPIYRGPHAGELEAQKLAERERRELMRSKKIAEFTRQELFDALMAIIKTEDPRTVREYVPDHLTFGDDMETFTLWLNRKEPRKRKEAPEPRVRDAGPGAPFHADPGSDVDHQQRLGPTECIECGDAFRPADKRQTICSEKCRRIRANRRSADHHRRTSDA